MGTTGRLYAVDLATGKPLWESSVGTGHDRIEKAKAESLKAKHIILNAGDVYGWLVVSGQTFLAPDPADGVVAFEVRDGKKLWQKPGLVSGYNMPAPVTVGGKPHPLTVNIKGDLRLVTLDAGETLWTVSLKSLHLSPLVVSDKHVLVYEPNPNAADDPKKQGTIGVLAAYKYDAKGATRDWVLPAENAHELHKDHGPTRCVILRDGLVYYSCFPGSAFVIREEDGKVLASAKDLGKSSIFLWGDKVVMNTDLYHRPRAANAEVWQMYDPATLAPMGPGWHASGNPPVHVATGGYELPTFDAFADGLLFCRVAGGIRCYDLRK